MVKILWYVIFSAHICQFGSGQYFHDVVLIVLLSIRKIGICFHLTLIFLFGSFDLHIYQLVDHTSTCRDHKGGLSCPWRRACPPVKLHCPRCLPCWGLQAQFFLESNAKGLLRYRCRWILFWFHQAGATIFYSQDLQVVASSSGEKEHSVIGIFCHCEGGLTPNVGRRRKPGACGRVV